MKLTRENLHKAYDAELDRMGFSGPDVDIAYGKIIFEVIVEDHNAKITSGLYQTTRSFNTEFHSNTSQLPLRSKT